MTFSLLQITTTTFETDNIREMLIIRMPICPSIHAMLRKKKNNTKFGIIKMCYYNIQMELGLG